MKIITYEELTPELAKAGCFVTDMPNEAYHAYEGISKSGLDKINKSPAHYYLSAPSAQTPAMRMGTIVHAAVLEPERFASECMVLKGINSKAKPEYKAAAKEHGAENVLTEQEGAQVISLQESVRSNQEASDALLECNRFELSAFVEFSGVLCRARYDAINLETGVSVDLKTARSSEREEFSKSVYNFRYHVQDAFYSAIFRLITGRDLRFKFLAVENEPPHCPMVYELDSEAKEFGYQDAMNDLLTYKRANNSQEWKGYEQTNEPLALPSWALARYENELDEGIV
jgi:exodeoxyribonuclease VIII